jgi:hypothetical protein
MALVGAQTVDLALDREERVDALHGFQGDRRYGRGARPAPRARGNIGEFEKASSGARPTQRRGDRSCLAREIIEAVVAAIGIGLEDAAPACEMCVRMAEPRPPLTRKGLQSLPDQGATSRTLRASCFQGPSVVGGGCSHPSI